MFYVFQLLKPINILLIQLYYISVKINYTYEAFNKTAFCRIGVYFYSIEVI